MARVDAVNISIRKSIIGSWHFGMPPFVIQCYEGKGW